MSKPRLYALAFAVGLFVVSSHTRAEPRTAEELIALCGAGRQDGVGAGFSVDVTAILKRLFSISGAFDARYFDFTRAEVFSSVPKGQRLAAYQAYVSCIANDTSQVAVKNFDARLVEWQGVLADKLDAIADQASTNQVSVEMALVKLEDIMLDVKRQQQNYGSYAELGAALLESAQREMAENNLDAAKRKLDRAVNLLGNDADPEIQSLRGQIAFNKGDYAASIAPLRVAAHAKHRRDAALRSLDREALADALLRLPQVTTAQAAESLQLSYELLATKMEEPTLTEDTLRIAALSVVAAQQSDAGHIDLEQRLAFVDKALPMFVGAPALVSLYSESWVSFRMHRFLRTESPAHLDDAQSRLGALISTISADKQATPEFQRLMIRQGQILTLRLEHKLAVPNDTQKDTIQRLQAATTTFIDHGLRVDAAQAAYVESRILSLTGDHTNCFATLVRASEWPPERTILRADILAGKHYCALSAGMENEIRATKNAACRAAKEINDVKQRSERLSVCS